MRARLWAWVTASKLGAALVFGFAGFLLIQLIPYGHDHSNPAPTRPVAFDSPRTEQLASDACGACHSDLTDWPIESNIAPTSWLIQHDVDEGRAQFNFSEWDHAQPDLGELTEQIDGGGMPPLQYKLMHPDARLSDSEKADLIAGLTRTYQQDPPGAPVPTP
jgi:hypothetical protein